MTASHLLTLAAGTAALAAPALAVPPVMDLVPPDAAVVVGISDPARFDKHLGDTAAQLGLPVMPNMGVGTILMMQGYAQGVDATRSLAMVFLPDAKDVTVDQLEAVDTFPIVMLLPVTSYAELLQGLGAEPEEGSDVTEAIVNWQTLYVKDLGDYAAIAQTQANLENFTKDTTHGKAHTATLASDAAESLIDDADMFWYINIQSSRDLISAALEEGMAQAKGQVAAMGKGDAFDVDAAQQFLSTIITDGRAIAGGYTLSADGLAFDAVASFNDDSFMANAFTGTPDARSFLAYQPVQRYLMVFAADNSNENANKLFKSMNSYNRVCADMMAGWDMSAINGMSMSMGVPPTPMAGMMINSIAHVATDEPQALIEQMKKMTLDTDGHQASGYTFDASWEDNAATVDGKEVHTWSMEMVPDEGADPMMAQPNPMTMWTGQSGKLSGYAYADDQGIYSTYSQNPFLLQKAMAAKGGENLADDALLKQVAGFLPKNALAEGYLNIHPIAEMAIPLAQMFAPNLQVNLPAEMPPIGAAIGPDGGDARMRVFVPMPVLQFVTETGMQVQQNMMGPNNFGPMDVEDGGQLDF